MILSSVQCNAGGDDDAFYSPKSSASFSSDASFSSTAEHFGRSPFEDDLTRGSNGIVSFLQYLAMSTSVPGIVSGRLQVCCTAFNRDRSLHAC